LSNAFEIEGLNKSYGKNHVLKNLSFCAHEGRVLGLLGANGAGKSTLISILNFITQKDDGSVKIFGMELEKNEREIKSLCSLVPQSIALYPTLSAIENMEYFGALNMLSGTLLKERIAFAIEATTLEAHANKKINELSGGLKRRVNLAVGLLNNPKLLYLDEPTVGVDPHSRSYILEVIKKLNRELGLTVIYTSHYMDEVEEISDDIVIIDRGEIVLLGAKEQIVEEGKKLGGSKSPLEELFLSLASNMEERV